VLARVAGGLLLGILQPLEGLRRQGSQVDGTLVRVDQATELMIASQYCFAPVLDQLCGAASAGKRSLDPEDIQGIGGSEYPLHLELLGSWRPLRRESD